MTLTLYYHPLASYCWKVLIALHENATPFEPRLIDLSQAADRAELLSLWPIGKFPVLRDAARQQVIAESSIIVDYLNRYYPGGTQLIPEHPDRAREVHWLDRFIDQYVHEPMQKIVGDKLRPEAQRDAYGVNEARARLETSYAMLERHMTDRTWALGAPFSLADCAAAPALFYADKLAPLRDHPRLTAYLARLRERPAFARVLEAAQPYMTLFPG